MLTEISDASFKRIQVDFGDDWRKKQWEQSRALFEGYFEYLKEKGVKETTAAQKANMAAIFIMDFLFIYYDAIDNILYVDDYAIKTFLGNWYIRKSMTPRVAEINRFLTAIADFYTFLYKKGFIDKYNLKNIKETCKDKEWFAQRLKSYFEAHEDEFEDWIMEYDYRMM